MTQMNTRIDEDVKRRGDAVFAGMELTPSDVVRAVWEYASEHGDVPAIVAEALRAPRTEASALDRSFKLAIADTSSRLVSRYRRESGARPLDRLEVIDYDSMRSEAWVEKLTERGLA